MAQRRFWLTLFIAGLAASLCSAGPTEYGTVTISKVASEAGSTEFNFTSPQFGEFTLTDGQSRTFDDLAPGNYTITEETTPEWQLYLVVADSSTTAATDMLDYVTDTFYIHLDPTENLHLTFHNEFLGQTPGPTIPAVPVPSAGLLVALGSVLAGVFRRHTNL